MRKLPRRALLLSSGAAIGIAGTRYFQSSNPVLDGTRSLQPLRGEGVLNDASGLSETPIHKHIVIGGDPDQNLIQQLRAEISDAAASGRPVNVGAARHSMGAHSIPRNGHAITFETEFLEADTATKSYRVHAGTRWSSVISRLDAIGLSPKVMQSNNDFGVAATYCVNAHGWPVSHGPMGATVQSFRMVMADGELVTCSRGENADLFALTMGGYGLTGLIVDLEIEAATNRRLNPTFKEFPGVEFGTEFAAALADPEVNMAYGRLNVDRDRFFEDALMITYRAADDQSDLPPASGSGLVSKASRYIFRAQLGNERFKRLRWRVETDIGPRIGGGPTRNSLINEPVVTLDDKDPGRTDILHEYFVAPDRFAEFVVACQDVIPASYQELLNITLRYVATDAESVLAFAPVPRIAAVMLFSQEMTERGEADMARMTRALIDRVSDIGGTYYLPYRLHATQDQFERAYPRVGEFVRLKRQIDPQLRFRNNLWDTYMGAL